MGEKALQASGRETVKVVADRGYYSREEVLACAGTGVAPYIPKTETSSGYFHGAYCGQECGDCC